MTTPLMLLLSSITPTLEYDHPVDMMYLNRSDRALLLREVTRLGKMVKNDKQIITEEDINGDIICSSFQQVNGRVIDIAQGTAVILTRLRKCYDVFCDASKVDDSVDTPDLDTDTVVLKLEGNPKFIYMYVYSTMNNTAMSYDEKMQQFAELYSVLTGFSAGNTVSDKQSFLMNRFQVMADLAFWQRLIYNDWMHQTLTVPDPLDMNGLNRIRLELRGMGFYGFVNPWAMYTEFSGARVNRKVELNVDQGVVDFLRKVVLSGGVAVQ